MKGISHSEKSSSMASSSSSTTTTMTTTEDSDGRRDSSCYFPDCRKDANCSCEICLRSLNATLDLMPLSVQKSSLTKLSFTNFKSTVESTPTSFDPTLVTTPASVSRPISNAMNKKIFVRKPDIFDVDEEEEPKKKKKKKAISKVVLVIGLVLCFELVLKAMLNPKFTEEVVRIAGERSQEGLDLVSKMKILEDELNLRGCTDSNSKWKINQDGPILNSKCVLYKSGLEEVSIWGWPLQTSGLFRTGFSLSSITVLSGRVSEWSDGRFGYSIHETNTSWGKTKRSTSVLQLDPNTWVLEYSQSAVLESSSFFSLTMDLLTHMMLQASKNVNDEVSWLYSESVSKTSTMTPT